MKIKIAIAAVLLAFCVAVCSGCSSLLDLVGNVITKPDTDTSESDTTRSDTEADETTSADTTEADTADTAPDADYMLLYNPLLDHYFDLIVNGTYDIDFDDGDTGVFEAAASCADKSQALDTIGYAVADISGDGVPELLIGMISEQTGDLSTGSEIFAVYTCADGEAVMAFEGWARNAYFITDSGSFYYEGSGGAMIGLWGMFTLSADGTTLVCDDFYFTNATDESYEDVRLYHNTSGEFDEKNSEELDINDEKYTEIRTAMSEKVTPVELAPFSSYADYTPEVNLCASWADDTLENYSAYEVFTADTSEWQTKVLFSVDSAPLEFKVLSLTYDDTDTNGATIFSVEEIYTTDSITPLRPLVVMLTFIGSIPNYGVSYTAADGMVHDFALSINGDDGSLLLEPVGEYIQFIAGDGSVG